MLPCHSCYICGIWRSKEIGALKFYRIKGEMHKQKELLWGVIKKLPMKLDTELLYLELPTYFSLLRFERIYVLHKIPSY